MKDLALSDPFAPNARGQSWSHCQSVQKYLTIIGLAFLAAIAVGSADPSLISTGSLETDFDRIHHDPTTKPQLDWSITHKTKVSDFVTVDPVTGILLVTNPVRIRVHLVGVGQVTTPAPHRALFSMHFANGLGWRPVFDGTPEDVPGRIPVLEQLVPAGKPIELGAAGINALGATGSYRWADFRDTANSAGLIRAFADGDPLPPVVKSASAADFLQAYLSPSSDGESRTFALGPHDLLFLFELNASSPSDNRFDLQDLAVLITFESA